MEPMFRRGKFQFDIFLSAGILLPRFVKGASHGRAKQPILCGFSYDPHRRLAGLLAHMFLLEVLVKLPLHRSHCCFRISWQNPGPLNVKYVLQLEHLPCSPDLLFWVISRCGFFMHQVSHSQDSCTSPVEVQAALLTTSGCARMTDKPESVHLP